ncbi:MAG TPA: prephenate dehydratase [Stellaceae bacterium]|nr:prephenate dehydratase [Stellaceae bacterium]
MSTPFDNAIAGPIAFQGAPGAYSDIAAREVFPQAETLPCGTFEDALAAVTDGRAPYAVIPIDNTVAGRVADVHHLLPRSGLSIVGEHFLPVHHHLLALPGVAISELKTVHSHVHALSQCRDSLRELGLTAVVETDTAGAAAELVALQDRTRGVLASELAGKIYGLATLKPGMEDAKHNTTRFVVLTREKRDPPPLGAGIAVTTFIFRVRNVPAALYKALGGFATNGINMTKLESYMINGSFSATEFYVDVEAHPDERRLKLAFEELAFFTERVEILGSYPAHPYRSQTAM